MSTASEQELGDMHGAVARQLTTILREGVQVDKGESVVTVTAPAAYFAVAVTMLKNNNITAAKDNEALKGLRDELAARRSKAKGKLNNRALADANEQLDRELGFGN